LAKKLAKELYLHNSLKHINIKNEHDYSALFVVNTPITDNSGIAHCVEHLIFRASKAFPHATTLFQLTALANVKINASTLADTTYFHCQSPCLESFYLALNYLFNGLFNPLFSQEDLNKEIHDGGNCGVIYRELLGIKSQEEHKNKQSIDKNKIQIDNSSNLKNSYNYSGDSQLIGKLSLSDLKNFHQQHYHVNNITLVTANADINRVSRLLSQIPKKLQPNQYQNSQEKTAKKKETSGSFGSDDKQQKKYSQEINELISVYYQWLQDPSYQKSDKCLFKGKTFDPVASQQKKLIQPKKLKSSTESGLITPLIVLSNTLEKSFFNTKGISVQDVSAQNIKKYAAITSNKQKTKQALPSLLNKLYVKAKTQLNHDLLDKDYAYVYDQHNALLLDSIDKKAQKYFYIMSYIINAYPKFLAPRCQGLCYAIQALVIKAVTNEESSYFVIYSAFDCTPDLRLKSINQSLLQLSKDSDFIQNSLLLAKIKCCRLHQVEMHALNYITPLSISATLYSLTSNNSS